MCFQWHVLTHPSIDLSWSANGSNMAKIDNDLDMVWQKMVKCNKNHQLPAKTCSSWWLISAPKQSVTQIACDGSTYTKNQIEMPSWQHHISRQSSEKPRWKNLVGAPPLSCALRPREKGHPNASSRTHWNLNIDLMSSFVKPVPNRFEHFQLRFRPFGPCHDICHHGTHPKKSTMPTWDWLLGFPLFAMM